MADIFSRHEPNRACLRHSRKTSCDASTTPNKLSKDWKDLFWRSGTECPSPSLITSLIPSLKGVQYCWLSGETVHPVKNDLFLRKSLFFICTNCVFFFLYLNAQQNAFFFIRNKLHFYVMQCTTSIDNVSIIQTILQVRNQPIISKSFNCYEQCISLF